MVERLVAPTTCGHQEEFCALVCMLRSLRMFLTSLFTPYVSCTCLQARSCTRMRLLIQTHTRKRKRTHGHAPCSFRARAPIQVHIACGVQEGITRKADVESVVRAAQDMILDSSDAPACLFSRNTVILEIRGAPVSLSLVGRRARAPGAVLGGWACSRLRMDLEGVEEVVVQRGQQHQEGKLYMTCRDTWPMSAY